MSNRLFTSLSKIPYPYFILFWLILNLIQAHFTELTSDEGYYWYYSTQLEWGYYDHPPMIALLIQLGYSIFGNELGVRFFNVILVSGSLFLFFKMLPKPLRNNGWLYLLLLSIPLFNYINILMFPDTPLLAFELLFLYSYQRFLKDNSWASALLIGLSVALMFYSKYHGVLVLGFVILSNLKLLLNPKIYVAGILALVLFLPHLYWQYDNGFPSFAYHLDGRISGFSTKHLFPFLTQQLIFFTPFLLIIPFLYRTQNLFERALKFVVIGTFIFFLYASLNTQVHFHWTSIALVPAMVLTVYYYQNSNKKRLINIGMGVFLVVMLVFRSYLMVQYLPTKYLGVDYFHDRDTWAQEVKALSNGNPVIFENNLREASLYQFYAGTKGVAIYSSPEKKSQYELWKLEDSLQGKEVMIVNQKPFTNSQPFSSIFEREEYYAVVNSFTSYQNVKMRITDKAYFKGDTMIIPIEIENPRAIALPFETEMPNLVVEFRAKKFRQLLLANLDKPLENISPKGKIQRTLKVNIAVLEKQPDFYFLGISYKYFTHSVNSKAVRYKRRDKTVN